LQININIPSLKGVQKELENVKKQTEKAVQSAIIDCKTRGPAQITKAVTAVYGIKASEVTEAGKAAKSTKSVGTIKIKGIELDSVQLIYKGRLLTPTHFSMTPKARPEGGRKYTVKAAVFKGQKKALGSKVFLAPSGAAGTTQIAYKRTTEKRLPIDAIRTVSIPQMITNETVAADIEKKMNGLLQDRLDHYTQRLAKK